MVTIKITISTPANDIVCSSAALISGARYSRMNSDWVSFEHQLEKIILKVIPTISFLCAFIVIAVVWTLLFFNIENDFRQLVILK